MENLIKQQLDILTIIKNIYRNYKKDSKSRKTKTYLVNRLQSLHDNWLEFKTNHKDIIFLVPQSTEDTNTQNYLKGETYSEAYECYIQAKSDLEEDMYTLFPEETDNKSHNSGSKKEVEEREEIKLPRINLPKFDGTYKSWSSFHDLYVTLIHSNKSLSPVQKLHYLKSSLHGEAEQLVRHFTITDGNYLPAWTMLRDRYDNPRVLIKTHLKVLFAQPYTTKDSAISIRKLIDTTNECVQSLENLKVDTKGWDIILTYLVTDRLPPETKKLWEQHIGSHREFPTYLELKTFLEGQFRALESLSAPIKSNNYSRHIPERQSFYVAKSYNCVNCSESHPIRQCPQFLQLDHSGRRAVVQQKGLCSNCLGLGHMSSKCPSRNSCFVCKHKHHTLLHDRDVILNRIDPTQAVQTQTINNNHLPSTSNNFHISKAFPMKEVLLATALINVESDMGNKMIIRALIDPGSQMTFITQNVVQRLKLRGIQVSAKMKGLGNVEAATSNHCVTLTLESLVKPKFRISAEALVLSELTGMLPSKFIVQSSSWTHLKDLLLADPQYYKPSKIDMIIGADIFCKIISEGLIIGPQGAPIAQNTSFGWILSGQIETSRRTEFETVHLHTQVTLDEQLRQFWELEELKPVKHLTPEEKECEDFYERTVKRLADGRYEVKLPFKNGTKVALGKSRNVALTRFNHLESKLISNPVIYQEYSKCLEEYLQLQHMSAVTKPERDMISYTDQNEERYFCNYLPHHAVYKESTTTKLRVVFDASNKTIGGSSLNDNLLIGPTLQDDMISILLRWRQHAIVMTADIEKMYRQIKVAEDDAQYQRILWRSSPLEPVKEYFLNTVTFGTACAPYLAIKTIRKLAIDESRHFQKAAEVVCSDFYVDDLLTGTDNVEQAINLQRELINLLQLGGFNLRKWTSNNTEVLKNIPIESREINGLHSIDLHTGIKTLGIYWCPTTDAFKYKFALNDNIDENLTKRQFLSELSKIFDPLGLLVPAIIQQKILMQALWVKGISWDECLPSDILRPWNKFKSELKHIETISIPRCIHHYERLESFQLHGFCDASLHAYAATIYARAVLENGKIHSNLLIAKSKVSPLKQITLPRLELCGAVLLTKLYLHVKQALRQNCPFYAWTDSTIVLSWLRNHPSRWKMFVGNRVAEIQAAVSTNFWRHVSTDENPADCATRGLPPSQLKEHRIWWEGPSWLRQPEENWPQRLPEIDTALEKRNIKVHVVIQQQPFVTEMTSKYSSLGKLLRITSFVFRFINMCRKIKRCYPSWITRKEMNLSLLFWIKQVQDSEFPEEIKILKNNKTINTSKLLKLNPFLDGAGIIRVGGRLNNANMTWSERHTIIIPGKHPLTKLLINEVHLVTLHGGTQLMLGLLRKKYWIIGGRNAVRFLIHKCVTCFRYRAITRNQLMGTLPQSRVEASRPFSHCGIDYCGPLDLRASRGRGIKTYKGYLAIFVCFVIKAIHIEVVSDLTTAAFLAALKRFTSRRGLPSDIYTDCGTNFVGANTILNKNFNQHLKELQTKMPEIEIAQKITWHFSPPGAPHFNGLAEAGVKAAKFHLRRILGTSSLTYEELTTLTTQVEACLNSRPLCALNDDASDMSALTPGHFLTGDAILSVPEPTYININEHLLSRWQYIQQVLQSFWKRWHLDYIALLQQRCKWKSKQNNLEPDDLVLVKDERQPPSKWLLARVLETHKGKDELVRVVTLKTKNGTLTRPVVKLCPLPIHEKNIE